MYQAWLSHREAETSAEYVQEAWLVLRNTCGITRLQASKLVEESFSKFTCVLRFAQPVAATTVGSPC